MDPDQTAPIGAVWSGSTLFVREASNILVGDKNIHFKIMRCKGYPGSGVVLDCIDSWSLQPYLLLINVSSVCIRLEFSWNARTFARL